MSYNLSYKLIGRDSIAPSAIQSGAVRIAQDPAAITLPEPALSERVRRLEARLDKLSSVLPATKG